MHFTEPIYFLIFRLTPRYRSVRTVCPGDSRDCIGNGRCDAVVFNRIREHASAFEAVVFSDGCPCYRRSHLFDRPAIFFLENMGMYTSVDYVGSWLILYQVLGKSLPLSITISLVYIPDDSQIMHLLISMSSGFSGSSCWKCCMWSTSKSNP